MSDVLVVACTRAGGVIEVLRDDGGVLAGPAPDRAPAAAAPARADNLLGVVTPEGADQLMLLLGRASVRGAVSEWLVDFKPGTRSGSDDESETYRLWAAAVVGEGRTKSAHPRPRPELLIVGTNRPDPDPAALLDAAAAALAGEPELGELLARLRAYVAEPASERADWRAQVQSLRDQAQPPPNLENRLLRMVAHDLRNPLLVLQMGCSYLLHDAVELSGEQRKLLGESLDTCEFMTRLVDGMVELAEVAVGELRLRREPTDLRALVLQTLRHCEQLARERASQVSLVRAAEVSLEVDPVRMAGVVGQLVTNALIHCPEGTKVELWLDRGEHEVVIAVADDGPGIEPDMHERLFRPFGKPHGDIDPRYYGAGVGLAVARRIVEGHSGRLELDSRPGRGSRFEVVLPLASS
ncbi:sensor histidine kinase [Haliangium sp.]|uniref:sensor histidine kinase n=1 Tax=Haliangium sp. TaxID=2663208 RepID=UPI003D0B5554